MRRKMLGSVAVWLAGGAALAADKPADAVPAPLPAGPQSPGLIPFPGKAPAPAAGLIQVQNLQPMNPGGPAPKPLPLPTVSGQPMALPPASAPAPAPVAGVPEDFAAPPATPLADDATPTDRGKWFGSVDYLLMWVRRNPTPPLAQTVPPSFANANSDLPPGVTNTIFGAHGTDPGTFSGVRIAGGYVPDGQRCWGVDGSYTQLFRQADSFAIFSPGIPVLGREFIDPATGKLVFLQFTEPTGPSTGFVTVNAPVEMYTFDANLRVAGPSVFMDRTDYLAGLRYLNLRDAVVIDSGAAVRGAPGAVPFNLHGVESFRATNQFYGSQVGVDSHTSYRCFTLDLIAKLAMGWVHEEVRIDGVATSQVGTGPISTFPNEGLVFVQRTNVGSHSRDRFAVVPEVLLQLGYQITSNLRATVGYDILTVSSVERSGAAINEVVNPSLTRFVPVRQQSTVPEPAFRFNGTDFWAQGITFGLTLTY